MKKLLALMLVLILVLSLFAGCAKTEEPAKTEEKKEEPKKEEEKKEEAAPSWQEEHPTWLTEEKVTLKVYTYDGVNATYLPPSNDLWFWQMLEEYTNVHIEWEIVPYADYNTMVQTKMAAGSDMPDIMNVNGGSNAMDFGQTGLLLNMAPYWDTCFNNTQAFFEAKDNFPFKRNITLTEDGGIYGIPTFTPLKTYNPRALMFNKLWMDELGLEEPSSIEELTEVLRAMKAAGDLNGNGADDEIILTSNSAANLLACGLNAAFGMDIIAGHRFGADENGVVFPWYTSDNQRAQLAWLNQMYEEGILDAEIAVNTADLQSQKIAADQVGVVGYYTSYLQNYSRLTSAGQADPDGQYYVLAQPLTSEYCDEAFTVIDESYTNFTAVTADCAYPELACKWIDTLYADPVVMEWRRLGPEGICWEMKDGEMVPMYDAEGKQVSVNTYGAGQLALCWIHPETNWTYKFTRPWFEEDYKPYAEGTWKAMSIPASPSKTEAEKEIHDMYFADLDACWAEYRNKFIIGDLNINDDAEWQSYVDTMTGFGLNELTQEFQMIYDRINGAG